jgi:glycosyltransferase involved in cell wall biosynthesis
MSNRKILLSYVPHGSSVKEYYKQTPEKETWEEYCKFEADFKEKNKVDFVVLWQNRNIRRKQPGDIILAFRKFCDSLPKEQADRCVLFMKTQLADENGTDLYAVKKVICPKYKVLFAPEVLHPKLMNFLYNLADVTVSLSSAEGFGLSFNESLHCGTCISGPVTGGLQDQMRFEDEEGKWIEFNEEFTSNHKGRYKKCGEWAFPIFPRSRSLQGSIPTPYIFDDHSDPSDLADRLVEIYNLPKEERDRRGEVGRAWVLSKESGMSSTEMCSRFEKCVDQLLETWESPPKFEMTKFKPKKILTD